MLVTAIYDDGGGPSDWNNSRKVMTSSQELWWSRFYLDKHTYMWYFLFRSKVCLEWLSGLPLALLLVSVCLRWFHQL